MPPRLRTLCLASSILKAPHGPRIAPSLTPFLARNPHRTASILSSLSDTKGAYSKRIRRGRGPASGKGKTSGRGQKGQHAHGKVPAGFEGGQTPLSITKPVRGRNKFNPFKVEMSPVNLDRIQSWIDQGRIDRKRLITVNELAKSRCIHGVKRHGVKLLARNADQLRTKIHIVVSRASASAIARVEALGGTVTTRYYSPTSLKRVLSRESHPVISLQAGADLISRTAGPKRGPNSPYRRLTETLASPDAPAEAKHEALSAVMDTVRQRYKYRLPDPAGRKDIEYYRDPAHRGYLSYTVRQGESPSLFFKPPREGKDRRKASAQKAAAKANAENRLF